MRLVRDEALMWLPRPKSTYSVLRSARGGEEWVKRRLRLQRFASLDLTFTAGTGSEEQQQQQQPQRFTTPRGTTCNMRQGGSMRFLHFNAH